MFAVRNLPDAVAILLRDDAGVMRFRAWRGLPDEYRAARRRLEPVDGRRGPIAIADVLEAPGLNSV